MTLATGSLLNNRYRILNILGHGGMGSVYCVFDELLKTTFALKQNLFLTDEYTEQFNREASIMASLHHHNLPKVGEFFYLPGSGQYLIMEYVEGEDLRQRIERLNQLPEGEVILIGLVICEALIYLHSRQPPIIHRDIKPGNIRVTPKGEVFLVDFGLAKVKIELQETITGARAMTPGYSPPEQYGSARTDERSDIYSLGATLYAALTGVIPSDGLERITGKSRLFKIRDFNPTVSLELSRIIEKAMEVDADDRYQTAYEFQTALFEAGNLADKQLFPVKVTPPPKGMQMQEGELLAHGKDKSVITRNDYIRSSRRNAWLLTSLVIIFGLLLILLAVLLPGPPENILGQLIKAFGSDQNTVNQGLVSPVASVIPDTISISSTGEPTTLFGRTTEEPDLSSTPAAEDGEKLINGGEIAFASDRSGILQIWTMNRDGSNIKQLTDFDEGACQPAWSADGKQIIFISPCSGEKVNPEGIIIYIMDADGSNIQPLTAQTESNINTNPVWRP